MTGRERPDNRLAICILMLPGCLPQLCWTERGIVWIKNPLKDKRLMSQSWMMTMKNDSLLPWMHSQDFPSTPAAFNPPSSPVYIHQRRATVSWDWLQWKTAAIYQQRQLDPIGIQDPQLQFSITFIVDEALRDFFFFFVIVFFSNCYCQLIEDLTGWFM